MVSLLESWGQMVKCKNYIELSVTVYKNKPLHLYQINWFLHFRCAAKSRIEYHALIRSRLLWSPTFIQPGLPASTIFFFESLLSGSPYQALRLVFPVLTPLPLPGAYVSLHGYKGVRGPHPHRGATTTPTHTANNG